MDLLERAAMALVGLRVPDMHLDPEVIDLWMTPSGYGFEKAQDFLAKLIRRVEELSGGTVKVTEDRSAFKCRIRGAALYLLVWRGDEPTPRLKLIFGPYPPPFVNVE
jgi:hypothetical protein